MYAICISKKLSVTFTKDKAMRGDLYGLYLVCLFLFCCFKTMLRNQYWHIGSLKSISTGQAESDSLLYVLKVIRLQPRMCQVEPANCRLLVVTL